MDLSLKLISFWNDNWDHIDDLYTNFFYDVLVTYSIEINIFIENKRIKFKLNKIYSNPGLNIKLGVRFVNYKRFNKL